MGGIACSWRADSERKIDRGLSSAVGREGYERTHAKLLAGLRLLSCEDRFQCRRVHAKVTIHAPQR
jgi:hypothetical protein